MVGKKSSSKNTIIIVAISLALALMGGGAFFFMKGRGDGSDLSSSDAKRQNILDLARDYAAANEYGMALSLLNDLLIDDFNDEEAKNLRDKILQAQQAKKDSGSNAELDALREYTERLEANLSNMRHPDQESSEDRLDRQRAEEERRRELEARRQQVEKLVNKGQESLKKNRYDEAIDFANAALRIIPDAIEASELKMDAQRGKKEAESDAERRLREEREAKFASIIDQARQEMERKNYSRARELSGQAREIDPNAADPWSIEGDSWYQEDPDSQSNRKKAANAYEKALGLDPQSWESHYGMGQIQSDDGDYELAVDSFDKAASINSNNADVLFSLGKTQYRLRRYSDAVKSFNKVVSVDSGYHGALFNLGLSYLKTSQISKAAQVFNENLKYEANHAPSYYELGRIFMSSGDFEAASVNFEQALELKPNKASYWRSLGSVRYAQNDYPGSKSAFERSLELQPDHGNTAYNLAILAMKMKENNLALNRAMEAVKQDRANPLFLYTLGMAAEGNDLSDQAIKSYQKAAQLDLDYSRPRINLGILYNKNKEYDKAIKVLFEALEIDPGSPIIWNNLGKVYLQKGDYEKSITYFQKATDAMPDDPEYQMNLALAMTRTDDLNDAIEALKKVVAIDPGNTQASEQLAKMLIVTGKSSEASSIVSDLEKTNPDHPGLEELKLFLY